MAEKSGPDVFITYRAASSVVDVPCDACSQVAKEMPEGTLFGVFVGSETNGGKKRIHLHLCGVCRRSLLVALLKDHLRARKGQQATGGPDAPLKEVEIHVD